MFTKYHFNQFLFGINFWIFGFLWLFLLGNFDYFFGNSSQTLVSSNNISSNNNSVIFPANLDLILESLKKLLSFVILIILASFNLHYFMNLVHLATHRLLSRNIFWNRILGNISAILCGLTLADFASTHLLHHRNIHRENPKKAPNKLKENQIQNQNKIAKLKNEIQNIIYIKIRQNQTQNISQNLTIQKPKNEFKIMKISEEISKKFGNKIWKSEQFSPSLDLEKLEKTDKFQELKKEIDKDISQNSQIQNTINFQIPNKKNENSKCEKDDQIKSKLTNLSTKIQVSKEVSNPISKEVLKQNSSYFGKFIEFFKVKIPNKTLAKKPILTDPDEFISQSPHFLLLPFLIFWHDFYFWTTGLWRNGFWLGYVLNRLFQIILVLVFWYFDKLNLWLTFWLLPIYLVGFANGMFLFYFPHYTTKWEEKRRILKNLEENLAINQTQITNSTLLEIEKGNKKFQTLNEKINEKKQNLEIQKNINLENLEEVLEEKCLEKSEGETFINSTKSTGNSQNKLIENSMKIPKINSKNSSNNSLVLSFPEKFCLEIINISRHFHRLHHLNVGYNSAYFPVFSYFCQVILPRILPLFKLFIPKFANLIPQKSIPENIKNSTSKTKIQNSENLSLEINLPKSFQNSQFLPDFASIFDQKYSFPKNSKEDIYQFVQRKIA